MSSNRFHILRSLVAVALLAIAATSAQAAFPLRAPQIVVNPGDGALQAYFNGLGETITVATDQLDAQTWSTSISGNSTLTLMLEIAGYAGSNAMGVYNGNAVGAPTLYQVFPGAATPGWHAVAHFGLGGSLVVTLFDDNAIIQGQSSYAGVDKNNFGFYLQGPGGTFYSQDYRNASGAARVITFAGTGSNYGSWWQCFEDLPVGSSDEDFNDMVLLVESVAPVNAGQTSWGRIKGLYR
jgi:hypothetical protein